MTAQELIKAALRTYGQIGQGETPSAAILQDSLEALKMMLRSSSIKDIYYVDIESFTLDGSTSYTIGSGGAFDTVRPIDILGGYTSGTGIDMPFEMIGEQRYRNLGLKATAGGYVRFVWYNPTYGSTMLGKVYVYPPAGDTITFHSSKPLGEPTGIVSTVIFPPEYDEWIKWNLSIRLQLEDGKVPTEAHWKFARDTEDALVSHHIVQNLEVSLPDLPIRRLRRGTYKGES